MKIINIVFLIGFTAVGSGCIGMAYDKQISASYSLQANHSRNEMSLVYTDTNGYQWGVVNQTVFAIGFNNNFIIAKQHPRGNTKTPGISLTNFYVIPLNNATGNYEGKNILGPLTETEYDVKREELHVPKSLVFSIYFDDLN